MENFGRPTILLPGHLDYHLSGAYIGISIHLRCLWDFGKRQIRPHTRTPEQSSRRTAKLSKVSCLENNLVLLGVVHYFKEWVSWLPPEGEERLRLPHKYPLRIYAYWKTSDDEVTIRCFSTWFDPSRTLTNRKGSTTQRYEHDDQIDETHLYFLSSGFIVIIISSSSLAFIIIYIRLIAYSIFPVYWDITPILKIYVLRPICKLALSCSQT